MRGMHPVRCQCGWRTAVRVTATARLCARDGSAKRKRRGGGAALDVFSVGMRIREIST